MSDIEILRQLSANAPAKSPDRGWRNSAIFSFHCPWHDILGRDSRVPSG